MSLVFLTCAGVALDAWLGEPQRRHPLVAFGRLANRIEARFNGPASAAEAAGHPHDRAAALWERARVSLLPPVQAQEGEAGRGWRSHGVTAWCLAVLPPTLLVWLLSLSPHFGWFVEVLALYFALGLRSLYDHAMPVAQALRLGDLAEARRRVGFMVSRDTSQLDETGVARAATESVLENGSDAVFAALFWFVLLGAPGVVLYRLSNTLDAMWGYRNARFERFGWAAARIDDLLNYLPARLVALTYALQGRTRRALACWWRQAPAWDSPNAGPVMAAGAGALGVLLGGPAIYHGERHERPPLGEGRAPLARDIERALNRVWGGVALWLVLLVLWGVWHA
ncbi:adenosylcobinamide-phosphate synthase CbiB [Pseudomonas indica]|uniref:adenosylcobinamide-phosphate synthase CbiB n=1 Tax=Pseudomonas indica TaxID=137658 RepID=UPI0023F8D4FD|nr:adenosylcobinamide-phosphate synthase CbiB [Pseudomonas indica]MBU3059284.1 cobalamin biosynthesis protein [Pseudomonas indica]